MFLFLAASLQIISVCFRRFAVEGALVSNDFLHPVRRARGRGIPGTRHESRFPLVGAFGLPAWFSTFCSGCLAVGPQFGLVRLASSLVLLCPLPSVLSGLCNIRLNLMPCVRDIFL